MTNSITVCTLLAEKSPQSLPLGAACIASSLKKQFENVRLLDFSLEDKGLSVESVTEALLSSSSTETKRIFLFSVFVWNTKFLCEVAKKLKEKCDCITVAGGPEITANATLFFDGTESRTGSDVPFDYVVTGEGEKAVCELVQSLLSGHSSSEQCSSEQSKRERIIHGKRTNLAELSSPYLDGTLDAAKYEGALWELARGCPFKCSYCYESKGEKTVDYFPLERLKAELEYFHKNNIPQIWVLDPTYNAKKERAKEMLSYIQKIAPEIFFHFECRAEFLDKDLVRSFSKINCCMQIGLQSADENVLRLVNRSFNKKDFIRKIALLNEEGIIFGFDLIYGLPGDSLKGFEESINFALSLYPNHLELFRLSVLPGTDLFDRSEELKLNFEKKAPYHIISTDKFSESDLNKAEALSKACNLFYSQGRAVPWFNSVMTLLKMKPTSFFYQFDHYLTDKSAPHAPSTHAPSTHAPSSHAPSSHAQIQEFQLEFLRAVLAQKGLSKYTDLVCDIVRINGAFARLTGEGEESTVELHYHPDDLLCEYAQDLRYFYEQAQKKKYRIRVFSGKNGADYRMF